MIWARTHMRFVQTVLMFAMLANVGQAMTCCLGFGDADAATHDMQISHMMPALVNGEVMTHDSDHAMHQLAAVGDAVPSHNDLGGHGGHDCVCMDGCMGMTPYTPTPLALTTPEPSILTAVAIPPAQSNLALGSYYASLTARGPPTLS
jgi:hypothetical protein